MPTTTKKTPKKKPRYEPVLKLPALTYDQFQALRDNIAVNGVLVPIIVDENKRIIDGTYRKTIADELGYDCPEIVQEGLTQDEKRTLARALNLARRQLTQDQKRYLIAGQLQETPGRSNRWIGKQLGVSHPTVAAVRVDLEGTGKIIQLEETLGSDGKFRPKRLFQNPPEQRRPLDFYPTPPHATQALLDRERFTGLILEPACGDGAIVRVLKKHGCALEATDILDGQDFFARTDKAANIITNPPYRNSLDFILHAKKVATRKIAMLLPVEFLHGSTRHELFRDRSFPLKVVYVFSSRLRFGSETDATVGHAWYVWERKHRGEPSLRWIK
jgi:ParB-like nuclease domain